MIIIGENRYLSLQTSNPILDTDTTTGSKRDKASSQDWTDKSQSTKKLLECLKLRSVIEKNPHNPNHAGKNPWCRGKVERKAAERNA